jgi:hypothetical protein
MSPHCFCRGADRRVLNESCSPLPVKVQGVFLEAECYLDALNSVDLGRGKRSLAMGECLLWTELCGVQLSAQVTAAVSLRLFSRAYRSYRFKPRTPPLPASLTTRPPPLLTTSARPCLASAPSQVKLVLSPKQRASPTSPSTRVPSLGNFSLGGSSHQTGVAAFTPATL